jgi:hypothetical protein
MFKPYWKGKEYPKTRLLILGESAYSWWENDRLNHPTPDHICESVQYAITNLADSSRFFVMVSRALANHETPSEARLRAVWERVAFTNYVAATVGEGARTRPADAMWAVAKAEFRADLEELAPDRMIILGRTLWAKMPETDIYITDDVQGYRLGDRVVMCQALDHPAGGLSWRKLASIIHFTYIKEFEG